MFVNTKNYVWSGGGKYIYAECRYCGWVDGSKHLDSLEREVLYHDNHCEKKTLS